MQASSRASLVVARERFDSIVASADDATLVALTEQLFAITHLLQAELRIRRALTDASGDAAQRVALFEQLVGSQVGPGAKQVVAALVAERWSSPRDLVDATDQFAALALFTLARRAGELDAVETELLGFARLLSDTPDLRAALVDPRLPEDRKVSLLDTLLGGKAHTATVRLVSESVLYPRGRTLDTALASYVAVAASHRNQLSARVRSAVTLSPEQLARLGAALERQYGRPVQISLEIDPAVVGGLNVQVGDEVVDATISRRLADARQRFAS